MGKIVARHKITGTAYVEALVSEYAPDLTIVKTKAGSDYIVNTANIDFKPQPRGKK